MYGEYIEEAPIGNDDYHPGVVNRHPKKSRVMFLLGKRRQGPAMELMLQYPEYMNQPNINGTTPLIFACKKRMFSTARFILMTKTDIDLEYCDFFQENAVMWALFNRMTEILYLMKDYEKLGKEKRDLINNYLGWCWRPTLC